MEGVLSSGVRFCVKMWVEGGTGSEEMGNLGVVVFIVDNLRVLSLMADVNVKGDGEVMQIAYR